MPNNKEKMRKRKKNKAYYPFSIKIPFTKMYKMDENGKC